jgi:hypothetical protein
MRLDPSRVASTIASGIESDKDDIIHEKEEL